MKIVRLTKASEEDAFLLSSIALKAKSFWNYPEEWIALWKDDLIITSDFINQHICFLLNIDDKTEGFCIIINHDTYFEIEHCWINPDCIGKGYGKRMLTEVLSKPEFKGYKFQVLSDPNALGFYQKFGFETIKQVAGKPEGRFLPLMEMTN